MTDRSRLPHCAPGNSTRGEKARKIEVMISRRRPLAGARLLEVGAGAGIMAACFAELVGEAGEVVAVDAFDQREVSDGYRFVLVEDAGLPFPGASFDIVVSNHVMEHVGDVVEQRRHLSEITRVLRPGGILYLAVPNRFRVIEPHFRLPFLSWLPQRWSSAYVRVARKGRWYDVVPPSRRTMARLLDGSGLEWEDCTLEAMKAMLEVERSLGWATRAMLRSPERVLRAGWPVVPSMVFLARRAL